MRIGELASATGLTAKTIRFYEQAGLMPRPRRTASGYRDYGPEAVERLRFVLDAKRLGLSLEEVRGILSLYDRSEPTCTHVRPLLESKLADVERAIQGLEVFRRELARLRDAAGELVDCRPLGGSICAIIEGATAVHLEGLEPDAAALGARAVLGGQTRRGQRQGRRATPRGR